MKIIKYIAILILAFGLTGCQQDISYDVDEIEEIQLAITGGPIEDYHYVLKEKENIQEALDVAKMLEDYKSPAIETWMVDIEYAIINKNGHEKKMTYKNIRPYDELFETVLQSNEVRIQEMDLYKIDSSKITSIILSNIAKEPIVIERASDEIWLEEFIENLKNYCLSEQYFDENRVTNPSCYVDIQLITEPDATANASEPIESYFIASDNEEGMELLRRKGIYEELLVMPEDIETMTLQQWDKQIVVTDQQLMQCVLEHYRDYHTNKSKIEVEYTLKEGHDRSRTQYGSLLKDEIPKEVEALFRD